jgi:hypothetical protein
MKLYHIPAASNSFCLNAFGQIDSIKTNVLKLVVDFIIHVEN